MYIKSIMIENLRSIRQERVDFIYPGRLQDSAFSDVHSWPPRLNNLTLLVGNNGSGKTTILDAVALAILTPILPSSGYRPFSLVRRLPDGKALPVAKAVATVELDSCESSGAAKETTITLSVERRGDIEFFPSAPGSFQDAVWNQMFEERSASFFMVGYGAQRRAEVATSSDISARRKSRALRYERVASLFEDQFPLVPLNAWLPSLQSQSAPLSKQVLHLLEALLPEGIDFPNKLENGEYLFRYRDTPVPFSALSDGFRAYISWIGDLLYHLSYSDDSKLPLRDRTGLVLVDEIDILVHPRWQRTMMNTLSSVLPNLQFIFTTHSPLIVGSLERANIYFVGGAGPVDVVRPPEEVYGLSADQILRSDVFGLDSTRDPEFQEELERLSRRATAGEPGAARKLMQSAALGAGADSLSALDEEGEQPPDWVLRRAGREEPEGA